MYQFLSYLPFLFSATNQHGVHSPFVYAYVTKCLYKKNKLQLAVPLKTLLKSIAYFGYGTVRLLENDKVLEKTVKANCPTISFTHNRSDVIFGSIINFEINDIDSDKLQNNTMLILDDIHKNRKNLENWEALKEQDEVRVTLDLFFCGVVFFRKEQAKEHFKIRI